jgi:peptide/nickel transport system permease protein
MTENNLVVPKSNKQAEKNHPGFWMNLVRRMVLEKPLGTFGLAIVLILFITGIFANFIAPFSINLIHLGDRLAPPSTTYLLGTDQLGRDELSWVIYGARISMIIGLAATAISESIAILIGVTCGYIGGKLDLIVQRFVDAWMSIPMFLLILTVMSIVGNGMFQVIMIIGIAAGIGHSRLIRSAVVSMKSNTYVQASEAIGSGSVRTMMRHILPNIMSVIIVSFTISVGAAIMQEASLSFLGFGVPPGVPSWGSMLSFGGKQYMQADPLLAFWPGAFLAIAIYGINMFGDSLRDLLDPRLKGGIGRYNLKGSSLKRIKERLEHQTRVKSAKLE